ncbi:4600_t:CDS:2, partial [Ambispora gerdemannii]
MSQQNSIHFHYYNGSNGDFSPTIIETEQNYNRTIPIHSPLSPLPLLLSLSSPSPILHNVFLEEPVVNFAQDIRPSINSNKRSKPRKSWVWNHMKKDKINKKVKCLIWSDINGDLKQCTRLFELKTSTTNLATHLRVEHRFDKNGSLLPLNSKQDQTVLSHSVQHATLSTQSQALINSSQPTLQEFAKYKAPLSNKKQDRITSRILAWIVDDMQPFNTLLTIESFSYPHTSEHIEDCLRKELVKWNLSNKYLAGITDNASSIVKAIRDLEILHIRCTAHTIQLGVTNGLKEAT